jgi:hypothetical protein
LRKAWTTYRLVRTITCNQFAATIDDVFYNNPIKGLNSIDLRILVQHIATTYAQISQPNLDNNLANFNMGMDPGLPLAVYTWKQARCQVFALNTAVPISKATVFTTGTKHALACSNMTMAWCEWNCCTIAKHTWSTWKTHWTAAFAKMYNINHMTVGKAALGTNAAEEEHQTHQITALLNNLANVLIQKNITINNLVASKKCKQQWCACFPLVNCIPPPSGPDVLPAPDMGAQSTRGSGTARHFTGPNTSGKGPVSIPLGLSQTHLGQAGLLLVRWT